MSDANYVTATTDGLPPLPMGPEASSLPSPTSHMPQFNQGMPTPANGIPKFFVKAVHCPDGSVKNVEMVEILIPGDPKARARHKVTPAMIEKYRPWYDQWRAGVETAHMGTPLEVWPSSTPALVNQLKANNIFTVEQLISTPDSSHHQIPMMLTLKNQARKWLDNMRQIQESKHVANESNAIKEGMTHLEAQNAELRQENAALNEKLNMIIDRLSAQANVEAQKPAEESEEPVVEKRRPGRPPKNKEA